MFTDKFHKLIGATDSYQAPEKLMKILYDRSKREKLFMELLEYFDYDVSYDWFHQYFQDEHADRKKKKQDFTPNEVGVLLSKLSDTGAGDTYYEVAAGTGGLMIQYWDEQRMKTSPFRYDCWDYFHVVEELSDRTIPFLLLNMMIRGMNGVVLHSNVIERECKGIFFIQNFEGDHLKFSDLNVLPYTDYIAEQFNVIFEMNGVSTVDYYPEHIERSWFDEDSIEYITRRMAHKENEKQLRDELPQEVKELLNILGM